MTLAQQIRLFALEKYVEPARATGAREVQIRVGGLHKSMGLHSRILAVAGAIGTGLFEEQAGVRLVGRDGPHTGASLLFTFEIRS